MIKIGITGGIGGGKSYVCDQLRKRGLPIYNCDVEAKRLMTESPAIKTQLKILLGENAYINDKELNKVAVAKFLFSNAENASIINGIVHPAVKKDFADWASKQHTDIIVQESALLFESGFDENIDVTIEVYAPKDIRLRRAMARDKATAEQIEARMAQQMNEEEKCKRADFRIINDGIEDINQQIENILNRLKNN